MVSSRQRIFSLALLTGLALLSLRPVAPLERALDFVLLPGRLSAELVHALGRLGAHQTRAAERELAAEVPAAELESERLLALEQQAVRPSERLLAGRRLVHAEVLGGAAGDLDRLVVHLATQRGLVPGLPVVQGDAFVGRLESLDEEGSAVVALATGDDFLVGARVVEPSSGPLARVPCRLVAGGLAQRVEGDPPGALHLAVHNPSRRPVPSGEVVVDEPEGLAERGASLASGFRLGRLESIPVEGGARLARIVPEVDFQGGLSRLCVLTPPGAGEAEEAFTSRSAGREAWRSARLAGEDGLARGRSGARLSIGTAQGVRSGAAVCAGPWLVGRVGDVAPLSASVRRIDDPGLSLVVLALVEGEAIPRLFGELVSLGRDAEGTWMVRGEFRRSLGDGPRRARLFTGAGKFGIPPGLRLGRTVLPAGAGRQVLRVERDPRADGARRVRVFAPGGEEAGW